MGNLVNRESKYSKWTIEQLNARLAVLRTEAADLLGKANSDQLFLNRPGRSPNASSVFDLISQARLSIKQMKIAQKNKEIEVIQDVIRTKSLEKPVHSFSQQSNNPLLLRF